jgi:hypothetical protein
MFAHPFLPTVQRLALLSVLALTSTNLWSQSAAAPEILFINMGGADCPPCRAWRALELPKLMQMPAYSKIKYVHVEKSINSPVPARFFLPESVKPLKEQLEAVSAGRAGSPQMAIVVNGQVYDYWWGTGKGDAGPLAKRFEAISAGAPDPASRCLKYYPGRGDWQCINPIPAP